MEIKSRVNALLLDLEERLIILKNLMHYYDDGIITETEETDNKDLEGDGLIAIYRCDALQSYWSRELIGIAKSTVHAITIINEYANSKNRSDIDENELLNIYADKKTREFLPNSEITLEYCQLNKLITIPKYV